VPLPRYPASSSRRGPEREPAPLPRYPGRSSRPEPVLVRGPPVLSGRRLDGAGRRCAPPCAAPAPLVPGPDGLPRPATPRSGLQSPADAPLLLSSRPPARRCGSGLRGRLALDPRPADGLDDPAAVGAAAPLAPRPPPLATRPLPAARPGSLDPASRSDHRGRPGAPVSSRVRRPCPPGLVPALGLRERASEAEASLRRGRPLGVVASARPGRPPDAAESGTDRGRLPKPPLEEGRRGLPPESLLAAGRPVLPPEPPGLPPTPPLGGGRLDRTPESPLSAGRDRAPVPAPSRGWRGCPAAVRPWPPG